MYRPINQILTARRYNSKTDSAWLQERIDSANLDTTAEELVSGSFDFDWIIENPNGILKYTQFHDMETCLFIGYTFDSPGAHASIGTAVFDYIKEIFPEKDSVIIRPAYPSHATLIKQRFSNVISDNGYLRYIL